ncbi:hypothetical protein P171DRAFT_484445 [Karstenula rhodostoma CBS 690.94]|uniref:Uncharacterized protein n=1 Tax=Karstenula rhodostoma CBS 690.94 TaxID=1392251 RepID=A0A9P4PMZ4_9PLEO|nr:hypothetical protein P171DRAFT_484445 [Karstenula rhodostoma CBS 690.94]
MQVDCGSQNSLQYTNATDNVTIENPFRPKEGLYSKNISSNWTWQLDTKSPNHKTDGNTSLRQSLSLSISPPPSPGLFYQNDYIGCGLIIHGAKYDRVVKSQGGLQGDCTGFISEECRKAILSEASVVLIIAEFKAKYLNVKKKDKHKHKENPEPVEHDVCQAVSVLKSNRTMTKCKDDFMPNVWFETFLWASSALNSSQCTNSTSSFVAHTWGASTYNSTSFRAYNNLTTSIDPIVTTLHMASPIGRLELSNWNRNQTPNTLPKTPSRKEMSDRNRRSSRRHVVDSSESDSEAGGSASTSDEEYGFPGGMGYGGFSEAAREGYYAGYSMILSLPKADREGVDVSEYISNED